MCVHWSEDEMGLRSDEGLDVIAWETTKLLSDRHISWEVYARSLECIVIYTYKTVSRSELVVSLVFVIGVSVMIPDQIKEKI